MLSSIPIRKAVIPAAGLGTRMFPVTKGVPKELLPIGGKPVIQYAIEEAVASGIEEVVVVTAGPRKLLLEDFLKPDQELLSQIRRRGKEAEAESLDALLSLVRITVVQQLRPRGLGDALLCARPVIGNETFALILPDAVIDAPKPALAQLTDAFRECPGAYVATQHVEPCDVSRFGMLALEPLTDAAGTASMFRVLSIVEKPQPGRTPSNFGVFGRYLLPSDIFADLERVATAGNGEVQLTDALAIYCLRNPLYAFRFTGKHHDAGNPFGYLQAVVEFAVRDGETGPMFRDYLAGLLEQIPEQHKASAVPIVASGLDGSGEAGRRR